MTARQEPTAEDLRRWRKLIRESELAADDVRAPMGELQKAAAAARRAVVPAGMLDRTNDFVRLQKAAERFAGETTRERHAMAADLAAVAAICGSLMPSQGPAKPGEPKLTGRRPYYWERD